MAEVIVKYNGDVTNVALDLGAEIEILSENYAIFNIEENKISDLQNYSQIEYFELPKTLSMDLLQGSNASCITSAKTLSNYNLSGAGVIVAILDSGIDYTHTDFCNEDKTSRILYLWDQSASDGTPPNGFKSGVEYTKQQFDDALKHQNPLEIIPQIDTLGHGTAVCGVAAGNGLASSGKLQSGVAHAASIIAVKLGNHGTARTTELMRAIKYVIEKAIMLNMPISINISYGTNEGTHDGESLFESYIDSSTEKWKTVISVAAGNEGGAAHHYAGQIFSDETQQVDFFVETHLDSFVITMLKNFTDNFSLELITPDGSKTGIIDYDTISNKIVRNGMEISYNYGQPSHYNTNQEITFRIKSLNSFVSNGVWQIIIRAGDIVYGFFDIWLPTVEMISKQTAFFTPSNGGSITIPATCSKVISVGGYNSRLDVVAPFSGIGLLRSDVAFKPDLVAPAVDITAPKPGGGYDNHSGTSIAAPFVTGSAALMMEWGIVMKKDPFLYNQKIKAFLCKGASRHSEAQYPNATLGYGTLCLRRAMEDLLTLPHA